jgi:hypothetical protein
VYWIKVKKYIFLGVEINIFFEEREIYGLKKKTRNTMEGCNNILSTERIEITRINGSAY